VPVGRGATITMQGWPFPEQFRVPKCLLPHHHRLRPAAPTTAWCWASVISWASRRRPWIHFRSLGLRFSTDLFCWFKTGLCLATSGTVLHLSSPFWLPLVFPIP